MSDATLSNAERPDAELQTGLTRLRGLADSAFALLESAHSEPRILSRVVVEQIDTYIERARAAGLPANQKEYLTDCLGALLGECILAATPGSWLWDELQRDWGLALAAGGRVFPLGKVWRQLTHGRAGGESALSFYDVVVDYLAKGKLPGT